MANRSGISLKRAGSRSEGPTNGGVRVAWEYEECTENTASAFARLSRAIERQRIKNVVLDMRRCSYLSVAGLRHLLQWHNELSADGVMVRVGGLSPLLSRVFRLAKLEWILADNK